MTREETYTVAIDNLADAVLRAMSATLKGLPWGDKWRNAGRELFGPYRDELREAVADALRATCEVCCEECPAYVERGTPAAYCEECGARLTADYCVYCAAQKYFDNQPEEDPFE